MIKTVVSEDTERNRRNQEHSTIPSKQSDSTVELNTINPKIDRSNDDNSGTKELKKNTAQEAKETVEASNHRNTNPQETPGQRPTENVPDVLTQKSNSDKKGKNKGCCVLL